MGTFETSGLSEVLLKFDAKAKDCEEACKRAVEAGGQALAKRLKEAAPVYSGPRKDVRPGALRRSIKPGKVEWSAGDGYYVKVAPVGKDHGESLAKIGNVLEYGRSDMPARPWFNPTLKAAEKEVLEEMARAFETARKD